MIFYIDVDDTLKRTFGSKSFSIPHMIEVVRELYNEGATLYCWSYGGKEYTKKCAEEFGIDKCFVDFLPKPEYLIDDIDMNKWKIKQIHPNECRGVEIKELIKKG